ncbi:cell envelope integrity TolA C-terminal domain-containing protein [Thaumasiovibrio subtropicus]|uniref:cell envelope integrity TolA C-terminal domain-containing protein n=1 Tax=Thaumasiovibrio subtropicus TaxID=1891207 RepID=UPI000B35F94F|nr:cell envelope integrity TolA C-terminal domain-containing protein [Thaumasiovibrio subtropicus]
MKRLVFFFSLFPLLVSANTLVITTPSGEFVKAIPLESGFTYQVLSDSDAAKLQKAHRLEQLENTLKEEMVVAPNVDTSPFPSSDRVKPAQTNRLPLANIREEVKTVIEDEPMTPPDVIEQTDESRRLHQEYRRLIERQIKQALRAHCVVSLQLSSIGRVQAASITEGDKRQCQPIINAIHRVPHFPMPTDPLSLPAARFSSLAFSPKHGW